MFDQEMFDVGGLGMEMRGSAVQVVDKGATLCSARKRVLGI